MTGTLAGYPAAALAELVRAGRVTATRVVADHLAAIARRDPDIGAFIRLRPDDARREAAALDARDDPAALPLAGVPIAVKDNLAVAGAARTEGCTAIPEVAERHDHPVVARLRAAGAVVVGITRMSELGLWGVTEGVRNPWRPDLTPGGSSGGSAAAVAAGMVPLAIGNDGLGSVRIPAACCGLVGLKPGAGVVPAAVTATDWFGMTENGPLASGADDLDLAFAAMAGRHGPRPVPTRLRVAVSLRAPVPGTRVDPVWRAGTVAVGRALATAGHDVREDDPPYPLAALLSVLPRWVAGATESDRAPTAGLQARSRRHAALGRLVRRLGLVRPAGPERFRAAVRPFFGDHDVLVTPALARPPLAAAGWEHRGWLTNVLSQATFAPLTSPWNLAGWPAAVVPAGRHRDGTPLSAQLVAAPGGEDLLISLLRAVETHLPWQRLAPMAARTA